MTSSAYSVMYGMHFAYKQSIMLLTMSNLFFILKLMKFVSRIINKQLENIIDKKICSSPRMM